MSLLKKLEQRSDNTCELCGSKENLTMYQVPPSTDADENDSILICQTCSDQIENPDHVEVNHWRCLNDSTGRLVPPPSGLGSMTQDRLPQLVAACWS